MGGVAYLSLEDNEVRREYSVVAVAFFSSKFSSPGAVRGWYQVSRDAPYEALPGHGTAVRRRKDGRCTSFIICDPQVHSLCAFESVRS